MSGQEVAEEELVSEETCDTTAGYCKRPFWPGRSSCKAEV